MLCGNPFDEDPPRFGATVFSGVPSAADPDPRCGSREHPTGVPPLRCWWIVPSKPGTHFRYHHPLLWRSQGDAHDWRGGEAVRQNDGSILGWVFRHPVRLDRYSHHLSFHPMHRSGPDAECRRRFVNSRANRYRETAFDPLPPIISVDGDSSTCPKGVAAGAMHLARRARSTSGIISPNSRRRIKLPPI